MKQHHRPLGTITSMALMLLMPYLFLSRLSCIVAASGDRQASSIRGGQQQQNEEEAMWEEATIITTVNDFVAASPLEKDLKNHAKEKQAQFLAERRALVSFQK